MEEGIVILYGYVLGDPVNGVDPFGLIEPTSGGAALGAAIGGPPGAVVGAVAGIIAGTVLGQWIWDNWVANENSEESDDTCPVKDLDPLHSPETIGNRPDIAGLSDDDLLDSANNPANDDPLKVNTETGKLVDGNTRAHELKKRANDPNSSITQDTRVKVEPYTPDKSFFWDF